MAHEETIKRIQELVPSVMDLEFGCEVENDGKKFLIYKEVIDGYFVAISLDKNYSTILVSKLNNQHTSTVILGKPITLSVVLEAIREANVGFVFVTHSGTLHKKIGIEDTAHTYLGIWNLSKDNFNDQSEETKTFIGELLN